MVTHIDEDHIAYTITKNSLVQESISTGGIPVDFNSVSYPASLLEAAHPAPPSSADESKPSTKETRTIDEYNYALSKLGYECDSSGVLQPKNSHAVEKRSLPQDQALINLLNQAGKSTTFHFRECKASTLFPTCSPTIEYADLARFTTLQPTIDWWMCTKGMSNTLTTMAIQEAFFRRNKTTSETINSSSLVGSVGPTTTSSANPMKECAGLFGILTGDSDASMIKEALNLDVPRQELFFYKVRKRNRRKLLITPTLQVSHHGSTRESSNKQDLFDMFTAQYYIFTGSKQHDGNPEHNVLEYILNSRSDSDFCVIFSSPILYEDRNDFFFELLDEKSKNPLSPYMRRYCLAYRMESTRESGVKLGLTYLGGEWHAAYDFVGEGDTLSGLDCRGGSPPPAAAAYTKPTAVPSGGAAAATRASSGKGSCTRLGRPASAPPAIPSKPTAVVVGEREDTAGVSSATPSGVETRSKRTMDADEIANGRGKKQRVKTPSKRKRDPDEDDSKKKLREDPGAVASATPFGMATRSSGKRAAGKDANGRG